MYGIYHYVNCINVLIYIYLSHDSTINPDGVFIRELCLLRDDYSLTENTDITKEEVSHIRFFFMN